MDKSPFPKIRYSLCIFVLKFWIPQCKPKRNRRTNFEFLVFGPKLMEMKGTVKILEFGQVCGSVGRVITSNHQKSEFWMQSWAKFILFFYLLSTVYLLQTTKKKKKELKICNSAVFAFMQFSSKCNNCLFCLLLYFCLQPTAKGPSNSCYTFGNLVIDSVA